MLFRSAVVFVAVHARVRTLPFAVVATLAGSLAAVLARHDLNHMSSAIGSPVPGWGVPLAQGASVGLALAALALVFLGSSIAAAESPAETLPEIVIAASPSSVPAETSSHASVIVGLGAYSLATGLLGLAFIGMIISANGSGNASTSMPLNAAAALVYGLISLMPLSGPITGIVGLCFALSMPRSDYRRKRAVILSATGTAAWAVVIGFFVLLLLSLGNLTF